MSTLRANTLIIGHPHPKDFKYRADFYENIQEASQSSHLKLINVLVISTKNLELKKLILFLKKIKSIKKDLQIILIDQDLKSKQILILNKDFKFFKILDDFFIKNLEISIYQANEKYDYIKQKEDLYKIYLNQNESLKKLNIHLEKKIKSRQQQLIKIQSNLESTQFYSHLLHQILISIQKVSSLKNIEDNILKILKSKTNLSSVKINLDSKDLNKKNNNPSTNKEYFKSLFLKEKNIGYIHFTFSKEKIITKLEQSFLKKISEYLCLIIDNIIKFEKNKELKEQIEVTFTSISEPLALVNKDFNLIKANKSFLEKIKHRSSKFSKNIFELFFNSEISLLPQSLIRNENTEYSFIKNNNKYFYKITRHKITLKHKDDFIYLIFFKDISSKKNIEKQILESSKMTELGTISSSIAHELNNPLGGVLSFIQLIKMDMPSYHKDLHHIQDLEDFALQSKDIIENLLNFSRWSRSDDQNKFSIVQSIKKSIKIIELQKTKKKINISLKIEGSSFFINGNQNQVIQAFCNILQNSIDALEEDFKPGDKAKNEIKINIKTTSDYLLLLITDNGPGIKDEIKTKIFNPLFTTKNNPNKSGLGLTMAFQVIQQSGGTMEILSSSKSGTSVKINWLKH